MTQIQNTITYPTIDLVGDYLNVFYQNHNLCQQLSSCISALNRGEMPLLLNANVPGEPITGIDIPILIKDSNADKAKGTIVILEQDPLRRLTEFQKVFTAKELQNNAIIGTPNAFHKSPVHFYNELVKELIGEGWFVYLTDTYKIWAPGLERKKDRWTKEDKDLLSSELSYIQPEIVLLCGEEARKSYAAVKCCLGKEVIEVATPHPSGLANRAWKKLINKPLTDTNKIAFILDIIKKSSLNCH